MADKEETRNKRRVARADPKTGHIRVQGRARSKKDDEGDSKKKDTTRTTTRIPLRRIPRQDRAPAPESPRPTPPPADTIHEPEEQPEQKQPEAPKNEPRPEPVPETTRPPVTAPTTPPKRRVPKPLVPEEPSPEPPRPARRVPRTPTPSPETAEPSAPEPSAPEPPSPEPPTPEPSPVPSGEPTAEQKTPPEPTPEPAREARPAPTAAPRPTAAPAPAREEEEDRRHRPPLAQVKAPTVREDRLRGDASAPWRDIRTPAQEDDLVKAMKRQSKLRARQDAREAERLEKEAKTLLKKAKQREKFEKDLGRHQRYVETLGEELGLDPRRPVTEIPPLPEGHRQVELEEFSGGLAFVRISYDAPLRRYIYEVLEPRLTGTEKEAREFLRDTLIRTLDGRREGEQDWAGYLTDAIHQAISDHSVLLDAISTQRVRYHLLRDFLGFGPIDVLMQDPMIEDISCDGPGIPLYLFHRQYESLRTNVIFDEEAVLDGFVIRLAQMSGKHISIADPLLDATLPDGSRLQSTLSKEVTTRGSSFTIRKFRGDPLTPPDLVHFGTMSPEMAGYFWFLMEHGMSLILAGGTASGKTTSLNAVAQFIPPQKKIVSIEDTREINLEHENWIAGVTRSGFGGEVMAGKRSGTIDMYDLLESALRQRPEFLIVGEVRGPEALTLFQAMATGHAVYSTMHADSVTSAVYRLENEPINVPRMMLQTVDSIAVQQQVRMGERMMRRITEVTEVVGFEPETGDLLTNTVFEWDVVKDRHEYTGKSYVLEHVMSLENLTEREVEEEWANRVRVIEWMIHKGVRRYDQVAQTVAHYYRDPADLLEQITLDEKALGYQVEAPDVHVTPTMVPPERIPEPVERIGADAADEEE